MHVLIVDDNLLSCTRLLQQAQAAGWTARGVGAGRALAAAGERRPDAVVINLAGTSRDPAALIQALKAAPELSGVPVLGFCGHREATRRKAALDAGCDRVVSNSSVAQQLAVLIQDLVSQAAASDFPK